MAHAIAPVFEIYVGSDAAFGTGLDNGSNFIEVLLWTFPQLMRQVVQRTFSKQVLHVDASLPHPSERFTTIYKREDLDAVKMSIIRCPVGYRLYTVKFAL